MSFDEIFDLTAGWRSVFFFIMVFCDTAVDAVTAVWVAEREFAPVLVCRIYVRSSFISERRVKLQCVS